MRTLTDVKRQNHELGHEFFSKGAKNFFQSKMESALIADKYFVTSERFDSASKMLFTVRMALPNGAIKTMGTFQQFNTKSEAIAFIKELIKT